MEEQPDIAALSVGVVHAYVALLEAINKDDRFIGQLQRSMAVASSNTPITGIQIMNIVRTMAATIHEGNSPVYATNDNINPSKDTTPEGNSPFLANNDDEHPSMNTGPKGDFPLFATKRDGEPSRKPTPEEYSPLFATDNDIIRFEATYLGREKCLNSTAHVYALSLTTDIRYSMPTLRNTAEYSMISARLAKSYDNIAAFLQFLMPSFVTPETDESEPEGPRLPSKPLSPEQEVDLKDKLTAAMALAIKHLRDRYVSRTAIGVPSDVNVPNLSRSSSGDSLLGPTTPHSAAWLGTPSLYEDPLTLSLVRALAIWLKVSIDELLRTKAAGIMEVLIALYESRKQDFRGPVCFAVLGILDTVDGVQAFIELGWPVLYEDLKKIVTGQSRENYGHGGSIIEVLHKAVEGLRIGGVQEDWLSILKRPARL
ncbi:hypothetical protein N7G274_001278 [Stereocaulon virgatum]|uniref:Uncharacterized protein n=1 Tax=Stereocaulon virgatum TaxID=373712 RepID=A0ABR4ANZ6_9LECA